MSAFHFSLLLIIHVLHNHANGKCPGGNDATQLCALHSDCDGKKEMCYNGECCSVVDNSMPCSLFSYREYAMQDSYNDTCKRDEDCPSWWKCCQTIIGKYCMEPEPDQQKCTNGEWPVSLCLDGFSCPTGYECNADYVCCETPRWKQRKCTVNMTNEQLEELQPCDVLAHCQLGENCCHTEAGYRCVPFRSRTLLRGLNPTNRYCPLYFYDYLDTEAADTCGEMEKCPSDRMCCGTVAGMYCLIPDKTPTLCESGEPAVALCKAKCPPHHECLDGLCCPTKEA